MVKDTQPHPLKSMVETLNDYLETRIDLVKYKTIDKSSSVLSTLVTSVILILGIFLFLFLLCIGLSFYLGEILGKTYYGFFVVGGFFAIGMIVLFLNRHKWIKSPFEDMIVKNMFNH